MLAEILICAGIALAIILGFGSLIKLCLWLEENTDIDGEIIIMVVVAFITMTFGVWAIRTHIRENKETKLQRRRI